MASERMQRLAQVIADPHHTPAPGRDDMNELTDNDLAIADYVVVGTGSAGSVIAERLSADPKNQVVVLEAGGRTPTAASKCR